MAPSANFAEPQVVYTADEPVIRRDDRVDEGGGQTIAEEFAGVWHEYVVNRIVRHMDEGDKTQYAVHWYSYTPMNDTIKRPDHTSEDFITRYWR